VARALRVLRAEPWHYLVSLALLVAMLLAYKAAGSTSGISVVFLFVTMAWFVLYALAIVGSLLLRAEDSFWNWFAGHMS
jgi:hypothetical protein